MKFVQRTSGSSNVPNLYPGHELFEIPRGQAAAVLAAAGFIRQYDSGDIQTVLVEVVPTSAAYNLVKAP